MDEPKIIIFIKTDAKRSCKRYTVVVNGLAQSNPAITGPSRAGMPPDRLIACQQGRNLNRSSSHMRCRCRCRAVTRRDLLRPTKTEVQLRSHYLTTRIAHSPRARFHRYRNQLRRGFSGLRRTDSAPAECTGAKYDDEFQNCNPPRNDTTFWPRVRALPRGLSAPLSGLCYVDDARGPAKTKTRKPVAQYFTDCFRTAALTDCRVSVGFAVKFSRFRPIAIAQASGAAKVQKSRRAIKYRHGTFHELLYGCVRCVTKQIVVYM